MDKIKEITNLWEKIGGMDYLTGYVPILLVIDNIEKGFNTHRLIDKEGVLEIPDSLLRKYEQIDSIISGDLSFKPSKSYLCKLIIPETAKDIFFEEITYKDKLEIKLKNGDVLHLDKIFVLKFRPIKLKKRR